MPTTNPKDSNRQPEYCWSGYDGQSPTFQITLWECGSCGYGSVGSVNQESDPESGCRPCAYLDSVWGSYDSENTSISTNLILSHCSGGGGLELYMWDNNPQDNYDGIDSGMWIYCEGSSNSNCGTDIIPGCTDPTASNWNRNANVNDNSCIYPESNTPGEDTGDTGGDSDNDTGGDTDDGEGSVTDPPTLVCECAPFQGDTRTCNVIYDDCGCAFEPLCGFECVSCQCEPVQNSCQCDDDANPIYDFCSPGFMPQCEVVSDCAESQGDLNNDGFIDVLDLVMMVSHILDDEGTLTDCQFQAADLNSDGIVNIQDLVSLVNVILNRQQTNTSNNKIVEKEEIEILERFKETEDLLWLSNSLSKLTKNPNYKPSISSPVSPNIDTRDTRDCNCSCVPIFENTCENQGLVTCPVSQECAESLFECPLCEDQGLNNCPDWTVYDCWQTDESECVFQEEDCPPVDDCPPEWYYDELVDIQNIFIDEFNNEYSLDQLAENLQTTIDEFQVTIDTLTTDVENEQALSTNYLYQYELLANYLGLNYTIIDDNSTLLPNYNLEDSSVTCGSYLDPLNDLSYCLDSTACDGLTELEIVQPTVYIQQNRFTGISFPSIPGEFNLSEVMSNSFYADEGLSIPCSWCDNTTITNYNLSGPGVQSDYAGSFLYLVFFEEMAGNGWGGSENFENGAYYYIVTPATNSGPAGCCTEGYFKITI